MTSPLTSQDVMSSYTARKNKNIYKEYIVKSRSDKHAYIRKVGLNGSLRNWV